MTDNLDGGSSDGTTQNTNSGLSEGSSDKQLSFDAVKLQSSLDALVSKVGELDARYKTMQGDKDKGISRTAKENEDLKRRIAEIEKLKKAGLDEDGAFEEHSFRETVREIKDQLSKLGSAQTQTTGNGASSAVDMARVLEDVGLDLHSPEVIDFMRTANVSDAEKLTGQAFLLKKRLDSKPSPSLETSPTLSGRKPVDKNSGDLIAELQLLQKTPTKNMKRMAEIEEKLGWK